MARTTDIGLRRDPHPPMPIVIPSASVETASSSLMRLSAICLRPNLLVPGGLLAEVCVALVDERVTGLVAHAGQVQLEREALLEPVRPLDVPEVDAVERFLGGP